MPTALRSAAGQATGWLAVIGLAVVASGGPMFVAPVPGAFIAALTVGAVGLAATVIGRNAGLWARAGLVAVPVLAPAAAAAVSPPGARVVLWSAGVAVVAFAVWWLRAASGMPRWPVSCTALAVGAVVVVDLLFRDPYRELRCHPLCASNPWVIEHRVELVVAATWVLTGVTLLALARAAFALAAHSPPWWRTVLSVLIAFVAILGLLDHVRRADRDPGSDAALRWTAAELSAIAAATVIALVPFGMRLTAGRRAAHWASDVERSVSGASVLELLRRSTGDPTVRLLPSPSVPTSDTRTVIARRGVPVAVLEHRPESSDRVRALLSPAAVAALENEALLLTAQHDLDELREARRAMVERSDEARRSLQRDLHDGAQQRLIVLALELSTMASDAPADTREALAVAASHAEAALAGLRRVAHGDLPPILHDEGLGEALVSLAEQSNAPLELRVAEIARHRFAPEVETVAYRLALSTLGLAEAQGVGATVAATVTPPPRSELIVTTSPAAEAADRTVDLDLVGAIGGSVRDIVVGDVRFQEARLPCE
jgi:signal transduction histidine kinase